MEDRHLLREALWITLVYLLLTIVSGLAGIIVPEYAGYIGLSHAQLGLLGFSGVLLSGLVNGLLPRWTNVHIHNARLARLQIRLFALGAFLVFVGNPAASQVPVLEWIVRSGFSILLLSWLALVYNLLRTRPYSWRGALKLARLYFLAGALFGLAAHACALLNSFFHLDQPIVSLGYTRFFTFGFIGLTLFGFGYGYLSEHKDWGYSWALIGLLQLFLAVLGTLLAATLPVVETSWREVPGPGCYGLACLFFVVQMWRPRT